MCGVDAYLDGDIHSQRLLHLIEQEPKIFEVARLHKPVTLIQTLRFTLLEHSDKATLNFVQLIKDALRFSTNTFGGMILIHKSCSAPIF